MPRRGPTWDVDDVWRGRVEARMVELGMKRADLARALGNSGRSVVTELLRTTAEAAKVNKPAALRSSYVPEVHAALEWPPPRSWLLSDDEIEMLNIYRSLDDVGRVAVRREAARRLAPHRPNPDQMARDEQVTQRLESAVDAARDQTAAVPSDDERDARGRRARRPPRGG